MKIIEEKHNHLDKVWRNVCHNCGSTLEYDNNDIKYNLYQKPFALCPVCGAMIPHKPEEWSKFDTTVQPTPAEREWMPPLNLEKLTLEGGIKDDQKFMRRDGRIATYMRSECPRGSLEIIMMVEGRIYRYNWTGVLLDSNFVEVKEREDDIIFMIK